MCIQFFCSCARCTPPQPVCFSPDEPSLDDTFFGVELPGLTQWTFGAEQAAYIHQPVLSVLGSDTATFWIDVAAYLRSWLSDVEERVIDGVGHLLHLQRPAPVADAIADFLGRHPIRTV